MLQSVLRAPARLSFHKRKSDSISLEISDKLPVKKRIEFKICAIWRSHWYTSTAQARSQPQNSKEAPATSKGAHNLHPKKSCYQISIPAHNS